MFRFVVPAVGLLLLGGWLFGNGTGAAAAGAGAGFVFGKVLVVLLLIGFASKFFWHGRRARHRWGAWHEHDLHDRAHRRSGRTEAAADDATADRRSFEERFDEWHRMAHAKDEVDGWTEDV